MAPQNKQESPGNLAEAVSVGWQRGQDLEKGKKQMREIIAHRLKAERMKAKLTQQELAIRIDINHLTYRGYENCRSDIPIVYLIRIADEFGVSLDYLTGRTDEITGFTAPKSEGERSTEARIARLEKLVEQLTGNTSKQ